jgi:hypothetical protein
MQLSFPLIERFLAVFCCPLCTFFSPFFGYFAPTKSDSSSLSMCAYVGMYGFELLWLLNKFSASFQFNVFAMFVACALWTEQTYGASDWRLHTALVLTLVSHAEYSRCNMIWPWNRSMEMVNFSCLPHKRTHRILCFLLCLTLRMSPPFCFHSSPLLCVLPACFPLLPRSVLLRPPRCLCICPQIAVSYKANGHVGAIAVI